MDVITKIEPLKIDANKAIRCELLCRLELRHSYGKLKYIFDSFGRVYFMYDGNKNVDLLYNNSPYSLKYIFLSTRRHKYYPLDSSIVGECNFYYEGNGQQKVILSIFLRKTRGFSQSQDFFSQFLSISVGTENISKVIEITTSPDWSPQMAIPQYSAFFMYERGENVRNIVLTEPVFIDGINFNKVTKFDIQFPENTSLFDNERLYFHSRYELNPPKFDKKQFCKKKKKINFQNVDPHENINIDRSDFPENYEGVRGYESKVGAVFITLFLLIFAITIVRGPMYLIEISYFESFMKYVTCGIWIIVFFIYFYIANPLTVCLFGILGLYGIIKEKIKGPTMGSIRDLISNEKKNLQHSSNNDNLYSYRDKDSLPTINETDDDDDNVNNILDDDKNNGNGNEAVCSLENIIKFCEVINLEKSKKNVTENNYLYRNLKEINEACSEIILDYSNDTYKFDRTYKDNFGINYQLFKAIHEKCKNKLDLCINGTFAWKLFKCRTNYGLFSDYFPEFQHVNISISIVILMLIFIAAFGMPFKAGEGKKKYTSHDGKICRNGMRILGAGYVIDSCYKPLDVTKYIKDKELSSKFISNYVNFRNKGRDAYHACSNAFRKIDSRIDMDYNYTIERTNIADEITDTLEIKACDFFNDFFADDSNRKYCSKMTLTQS